ncbi:DUF1643 domain-containing protein [Halomicronema sp. CCY15110]|uniref:DUF1643 domain-containing protein n=1 Tax=Halomicronema sp. CCY15110 TaxID=2767773 RepID=UPI001EF377D9|nr:DUF1643 domain-containing protein [Halomicronema sp. CCY15110]
MSQWVNMQRAAKFDETGQYRYWLRREWAVSGPAIALIMLNPSRADHRQDDPTLRRCTCLAQQWQFGRLTVVNLFAYCTASPQVLKTVAHPIGADNTASPQVLKTVAHPIGADNDEHIVQACAAADRILLAWGNWGSLHQRDQAVLNLLTPFCDRLCCLGLNRTGQPRHPLYVPRQSLLQPWPPSSTDITTDDSLSKSPMVRRSMAG